MWLTGALNPLTLVWPENAYIMMVIPHIIINGSNSVKYFVFKFNIKIATVKKIHSIPKEAFVYEKNAKNKLTNTIKYVK